MTIRAVRDIHRLLDSIERYLIMAGVPANQIRIAQGVDYSIKVCAKAYDWLHRLSMSAEMDELKRVRALRNEEQWSHYTFMGIEGLTEQVMLKKAGIALLKVWRTKRPRMFGPDPKPEEPYYAEGEGCQQEDDSTDPAEQRVQPDGAGSDEGDR